MRLWRIAAETRQFSAEDLSGAGTARHSGRWNEAGEPVVYAAPSLAFAVLETAAHIVNAGLPLNRFVVAIDMPDAVWALQELAGSGALFAAWLSIPGGRASIRFGSDWLRSQRSPILLVPSAIVPEEHGALVNPRHPMCARITATVLRPFDYSRFFRSSS